MQNFLNIVNLIACTRPHLLDTSYRMAKNQGHTAIEYDPLKAGHCVTRNKMVNDLLQSGRLDSGSFIRFVDDDDIPLPIVTPFPVLSDVVITSFMSNQQLVAPTSDIQALPLNSVVGGNWAISRRAVQRVVDHYGGLFDPLWERDTGYHVFNRFLKMGLEVLVLPQVVSYIHRRDLVPNSISSTPPDMETLHEIRNRSIELKSVDGLMRSAYATKTHTHAINVMNKYRRKTGRWPKWFTDPEAGFSDKMAWRAALDSRPVMQDLCSKELGMRYAQLKGVEVLPYWTTNLEGLHTRMMYEMSDRIYKLNRASGRRSHVVVHQEAPDSVRERAVADLKEFAKTPYYRTSGEFGYVGDQGVIKQHFLRHAIEFSVYCFNNETKFGEWRAPGFGCKMITNLGTTVKVNHLRPTIPDEIIPKVSNYTIHKMFETAKLLTKDIDFVRVDFLVDRTTGAFYFNEFSPYANGVGTVFMFEDPSAPGDSADYMMGRRWPIHQVIDVPFENCLDPNKIDEAFRT